MRPKSKPLAEQVIIVAGAGSALGQAVARRAAEAGAAVLLTSPDEPLVRRVTEEINAGGGRAHAVVADASDANAVARVARAAIARFGGFDSWIHAGGEDRAAVNGAYEAATQSRAAGGPGAVIHLAAKALPAETRRILRRAGVFLTHVALPAGELKDVEIAAASALHAIVNPVRRMAIGQNGKLTLYSQARRRRGVLAGVGLLAVAGAAVWIGRGKLAALARPPLVRAVRPLALRAVRRRPLQAAKLALRHPRQALRIASALR